MPTPRSQTERVMAARLAAHERWALEPDRQAATAPARAGFMASFERKVDPDGVLSAQERAKRAENARQAHYTRMGLASAKARRKSSSGSRDDAPELPPAA